MGVKGIAPTISPSPAGKVPATATPLGGSSSNVLAAATALFSAVGFKDVAMVQTILRIEGGMISAGCEDTTIPFLIHAAIFVAAKNRSILLLKLLLDHFKVQGNFVLITATGKTHPIAPTKSGYSLLHMVVHGDAEEHLDALAEEEAGVAPSLRIQPVAAGVTAQALTMLVASGVPIDSVDAHGCTALHLAVANVNEELVGVLMREGASVTGITSAKLNKQSALHIAICSTVTPPTGSSKAQVVQRLLTARAGSSGSVVELWNGRTIPFVDFEDKSGLTALEMAVSFDYQDITTSLLRAGATIAHELMLETEKPPTSSHNLVKAVDHLSYLACVCTAFPLCPLLIHWLLHGESTVVLIMLIVIFVVSLVIFVGFIWQHRDSLGTVMSFGQWVQYLWKNQKVVFAKLLAGTVVAAVVLTGIMQDPTVDMVANQWNDKFFVPGVSWLVN